MPSCKTQRYITRTAAAARNLDATTLRSAAPSGKPNVCLRTCGNRTWQHSCSHCTAICHRSPKTARKRTTARCKTPVGTNPRQNERPSSVAQTRYPLSPTKKHNDPASTPTQVPCNIRAAMTLRFATLRVPKHHATAMCRNMRNTSKQPL